MVSGCQPDTRISETRAMLGTDVTILVLHPDEDVARIAISKAFSAIERVEAMMGPSDSEIARLNTEKTIIASPELIYVINRSIYFSHLSDGAFDPTVKPLLDKYTESFRTTGAPPSNTEIEKTLSEIGYHHIRLAGSRIEISEGVELTLGAIAKGFAIDSAVKTLEQEGIRHAIVDAGGDMRVIGKKERDLPWTIALQNPRNNSEYIALLALESTAVATSGDYERYYDPDLSAHHIMDPKTGKSATELMSVTIISPTAINADALATTVFVLGPDKGLALIEQLSNAEGILITREREIIRSSGFSTYESR